MIILFNKSESMSKHREYHILMADIIDSRSKSGRIVGRKLKSIVKAVNASSDVISPFVVTLGDEFQGVLESLQSACEAVVQFEYACLEAKVDFQLRYSLHRGIIETDINPELAHGMLGPGLTHAREMLEDKGPGRAPVLVDVGDPSLNAALENLFSVLFALKARWKVRDYPLVMAMLSNENDSDVGEEFRKDRSQIWKRRNTLLIQEYGAISQVISWASSIHEPR